MTYKLRNTPRSYTYPVDLGFITGVMMGSGYEAKCWRRDFIPFEKEFEPDWEKEFELRENWLKADRNVWVVFSTDGKTYHEEVVSPSGIRFTKELSTSEVNGDED